MCRWLGGRSFVGQQLGGSVAATVRRLIQEKIHSDFYAFPLIKPINRLYNDGGGTQFESELNRYSQFVDFELYTDT